MITKCYAVMNGDDYIKIFISLEDASEFRKVICHMTKTYPDLGIAEKYIADLSDLKEI